MDRQVRDASVLPERLLRPVPVVDVEVGHQDPPDAVPPLGVPGRDGDGVEEAEAHRLRSPGVVSGRSRHDEAAPRRVRPSTSSTAARRSPTVRSATSKVDRDIGLSGESKSVNGRSASSGPREAVSRNLST